jgi:cell division protein FtsB
MTALLTIKNLIYAVVALVVLMASGYLAYIQWDRARTVDKLTLAKAQLEIAQAQLTAAQDNIKDIKVLNDKVSAINAQSRTVLKKIDDLKITNTGAKDENKDTFTLYNGLVDDFNGVRGGTTGSDAKVLPGSATTKLTEN